jgi:hydroxyacylglutathione hydrolase
MAPAPVVDRYVLGAAQENCYLVRADRGAPEAVVVDPGDAATELRLELARAGTRCAAILVTHCHYDHIGAVADLAEGTGAPVYMAREEAPVMASPDEYYGALGVHVRPYEPDVLLDGDETFEAAGLELETLLVPGHSPAHLAFFTDGCLFSGDVLFQGGVGRTDLLGGDWDTLVESIRSLVDRFPPETVVYPGHGPATTLGAELARNPFLVELRA